MRDFTEGLILLGIVIFGTIFVVLYLRKQKPEVGERFRDWITSWGLVIVGMVNTLINIAIYFLDKTQFEFPQLAIAVSMMMAGVFYVRKYKNQRRQKSV
jgi:hypothetical protein